MTPDKITHTMILHQICGIELSLISQKNPCREKELWQNKSLSPTAHEQIHRNLPDNEIAKAEPLENYDVSWYECDECQRGNECLSPTFSCAKKTVDHVRHESCPLLTSGIGF